MMFSLWLQDAQGDRAAYDFGFDWDGENSADWQCSPGRGGPSWSGTIRWSNQHVDWIDYDEEPEPDGLGDELLVTCCGGSGQAVLQGAAVTEPFRRDSWVDVAEELFGFLRENGLI